MHRVPRSSNVRRRLFPDDDITTQAKVDNSSNYLQESIERDIKEKIQKWNFDFENDVPLEGLYEWTPCIDDSQDWIGRKRNLGRKIVDLAKEDEILVEKVDSLVENNEILEEHDEILVEHDEILEEKDAVLGNKNSDLNNDVFNQEIESEDLLIPENNEIVIVKEQNLSIKELNEITPRNYRVDEIPMRKRKNEIIDAKDLDKGVRRKISFD